MSGEKKTIDPAVAERITPELTEAVMAHVKDGKIACERLRRIAEEQGVSYKVAGAAADTNGVKVRDCGLGCF